MIIVNHAAVRHVWQLSHVGLDSELSIDLGQEHIGLWAMVIDAEDAEDIG